MYQNIHGSYPFLVLDHRLVNASVGAHHGRCDLGHSWTPPATLRRFVHSGGRNDIRARTGATTSIERLREGVHPTFPAAPASHSQSSSFGTHAIWWHVHISTTSPSRHMVRPQSLVRDELVLSRSLYEAGQVAGRSRALTSRCRVAKYQHLLCRLTSQSPAPSKWSIFQPFFPWRFWNRDSSQAST